MNAIEVAPDRTCPRPRSRRGGLVRIRLGRGKAVPIRAGTGQERNGGGPFSLGCASGFSSFSSVPPSLFEATFELGICEETLGNPDAALAAWSGIPAASPLAVKASLGRARLLMNSGRFAASENVLLSLPRGRGHEGRLAGEALELLYHLQGRTSEVRELVVERWAFTDNHDAVLRRLYQLDHAAFPVDYVRKALEAADQGDDRVWLGQANLAAWSGRFDEAARLLTACARRRPEDLPIWRARLDLARSSGDLASVRQAVAHLPLSQFTKADILKLRAWVAGRQKDAGRERSVLLALVGVEPENISAWDRLAELAFRSGRSDEGEKYHKQAAAFNRMREEYKALIDREDRAQHCRELATLAGKLGRPVEALGWSLIDQGRAASQPLEGAVVTSRESRPGERLESAISDLLPALAAEVAGPSVGHANATPRFADDAESAGLRFLHDNGHTRRNPPPPEAMCGGVGLLDFDGDGWLDVYAVQAGTFQPQASGVAQGDRLFRNRGDGTFEDVTVRAGIASFEGGYGHGVAVGDYDNDGRPDLFVTRWRSYALYRNAGKGRFEDVTRAAGLGGDRDWPTSAVLADLDSDGDLDLYVCHYLAYDPANPRRCVHEYAPSKHDCNPLDFPALPDHVFRNDRGRFVEVTVEAGFTDPNGRGLGVVAADLDGDNRIDLYVANDMTANYLFKNRGGFRFEETGQVSGAAASADGGYKAGMGIACGDLDGDGFLDLAVTNYFGESTTFYRNLGGGFFADHSSAIGMTAPTRRLLGFGLAFLDADNDGRLDVLSANGHVLDARPQFPWTMPIQLLRGTPGGGLTDVSEQAGEPFGPLHLGRGLAVGDLDNDGRLDAVVLAQNEPVVYLHNQGEHLGHFIVFALEGTKSNRDGVGASVKIVAGGQRQVAQRCGGGSYQSASDPRLHFGIGDATTVESVEVRWPSGQVDRHGPLGADREYVLREGAQSAGSRPRA